MSDNIDVLAVMDREARVANAYRLESGADVLAANAAEDAAEARAAVAELIEAAGLAWGFLGDVGFSSSDEYAALGAALSRAKGDFA